LPCRSGEGCGLFCMCRVFGQAFAFFAAQAGDSFAQPMA
jgi:hypothetical protein